MPFNSKTASEAGKKSKRKRDQQISDLRDFFIDLSEEHKEKLTEALDRVYKHSPARYIELYLKVMAFALPKADSEMLRDIKNNELDLSKVPLWMTTKITND